MEGKDGKDPYQAIKMFKYLPHLFSYFYFSMCSKFSTVDSCNFFKKYVHWFYRERKGERQVEEEREPLMGEREKDESVASVCAPNTQPTHVP